MLTIHVWPKWLKRFLLTHPLYKSPSNRARKRPEKIAFAEHGENGGLEARSPFGSPRLRSSFASRALAGSSLRSLSLCDLPYETLRVSSAHVFSVADPSTACISTKDKRLFLCALPVPSLRLRFKGKDRVDGHGGFGERNRPPERRTAEESRQHENQRTRNDQSARQRDDERNARLQRRLEVVGREHVEWQEDERQRVGADDAGRDRQHRVRRTHEQTHEGIGRGHQQGKPDDADENRRPDRIPQGLRDAAERPGAVVLRKDRLRRLSHAIAAALHERADHHDHAIDGQLVRAEILEYLAVEQHREDAHRDVDEEDGEADLHDLAREQDRRKRQVQPQGVAAAEEV